MLEVDNVQAGYGKALIVDGVSINVPTGSIVALLGGNGTGKSTTLRAIFGLVKPVGGDVRLNGESLVGLKPPSIVAKGLALVPQGKEAFADMTVKENLLLGAYLLRRDRSAVAAALAAVMDRFPRLGELAGRRAGHLSGGERQLLALGRALMSRPKLLLLDEPSMGLAPNLVTEIFNIVKELNQDGCTILLVEQNAVRALEVAHRAYCLETGHVVLTGSGKELLADPKVKEAYLGG